MNLEDRMRKRGRVKPKKGSKSEEQFSDSYSSGSDEEKAGGDGSLDVKKKIRLIKNREAAQQFRQRQKQYIQDLENQVQALTATNQESQAKVQVLREENKQIKDQLTNLRNFISQAMSLSLNNLAQQSTGTSFPLPMMNMETLRAMAEQQGLSPAEFNNMTNMFMNPGLANPGITPQLGDAANSGQNSSSREQDSDKME